MINCAALIFRYKAPAVRWINEADPYPDTHHISIEEANEEQTIYLISDKDGDTSDDVH